MFPSRKSHWYVYNIVPKLIISTSSIKTKVINLGALYLKGFRVARMVVNLGDNFSKDGGNFTIKSCHGKFNFCLIIKDIKFVDLRYLYQMEPLKDNEIKRQLISLSGGLVKL